MTWKPVEIFEYEEEHWIIEDECGAEYLDEYDDYLIFDTQQDAQFYIDSLKDKESNQ